MDVILRIGAILALVGLNAFFVAAEFALVGARATRLQTLTDAGDRAARLALNAILMVLALRLIYAGLSDLWPHGG